MKLLIATHNAGKKREYARLLAGLDVEITTLAELGVQRSVPEEGISYAENALAKARSYAADTGILTLADDSGLEVDALDGAPGVRSARFAGGDATDAQRCAALLKRLRGVPEDRRTARFRCAIALAWPGGRAEIMEGTCEGRIALKPQGENGFGYDPVFYVPEYGCTMAELPDSVKDTISHRGRAAALARAVLSA